MFCMNCGTQLPEGSRFCSNCGAPQQPMYQQPMYQQSAPPVYGSQSAYAPPMPTGALLREANKVSRYNGGGAIGAVTGTGDLYVYDRLEFHKKSGDQRGYLLGPVLGAAIARGGAKLAEELCGVISQFL